MWQFSARQQRRTQQHNVNGVVAADNRKMLALVKQLSDYLCWAGYETNFKIYDDKFNYIAEFPGNAV